MRKAHCLSSLACVAGLVLSAQALLAGAGYKDTPMLPDGKWHVHDSDRPMAPVVTPGEQFSQGAPAPSDAVVLFDGKDFSKWANGKGQPPTWKLENGYMEAVKGAGNVHTKDEFGDCQLHLEWAAPPAKGDSQDRGNSGVFLMGRYELQVLDCYNNGTYADGQCGAIYAQCPPRANACKPPGQWQCYDIVFEVPRWDAAGKLVKPAFITVFQNGVLLHNRQELIGNTPHRAVGKYSPHPPTGPIELQDHGNPIRYRNIWVRPLTDKS